MNYVVKILFLVFSMSAHSSEPAVLSDLAALQWNHRIVVVNEVQSQEAILALFEKNKSKIDERDIIWFVFTDSKVETNYQGGFSEDFIAHTKERYQIKPGKIMLIGKDGGVKFLLDRMDLEAIFSEIDAMPMRQNEMLY
ncbi:DUF4174 domain-containing protein [Rheinheimera sp. 1928-s]|uniref:DUF4174 domain-containing protein n=1 Tax=Rheinheimera sp. 1928-s TaxID=3033803 RepID=UPI002631A6BC|nr:DUF4174 domain-containing protein [Rheinheimera sp. 1928-s]MDF3126417.1 DUF4174 domain-containing protein [Rheinheimera sp. 1928-s]